MNNIYTHTPSLHVYSVLVLLMAKLADMKGFTLPPILRLPAVKYRMLISFQFA